MSSSANQTEELTVQVSLISTRERVIVPNQLVLLRLNATKMTVLDLLFQVSCENDRVLRHLIALENVRLGMLKNHQSSSVSPMHPRQSSSSVTESISSSESESAESSDEISNANKQSKDSLITALGMNVPCDESCPPVSVPIYGNSVGLLTRHGWNKIEFTISHNLLMEAEHICSRMSSDFSGMPPTFGYALPTGTIDGVTSTMVEGELGANGTVGSDELFEHEIVAADLGLDFSGDDHFTEGNFHYKRFIAREPLFTQMLNVTEFASLMNIFVALLIVFLVGVLYDELLRDDFQFFSTFRSSFSRLDLVAIIWGWMFITSFGAVLLIDLYKSRYFDTLGMGLWYCAFMALFLYIPVKMLRYFELSVPSCCIIACEEARLALKIHAYMWECFRALHFGHIWAENGKSMNTVRARLMLDWVNSWEVALAPTVSGDNDGTVSSDHSTQITDTSPTPTIPNPTNEPPQIPAYLRAVRAPLFEQIQTFGAFLFFPCLVYRTRYPRTGENINWSAVTSYAYKFFMCYCFVSVIFTRFCIPVFEDSATNPGSVGKLITSVLNSTLPGCAVILIGFFSLLQFWNGMFAELTRFADKSSYGDWWAVKTWAAFYRKFNLTIYTFLHDYFFLPMLEAGYSAAIAELTIIMFSAMVYEYMICLVLGFIFPVFLVSVSFVCGFVYSPLTQTRKKGSGWHIVLWLVLYLINGLNLVLYSREWYARRAHAEGKVSFDENSWLPFSFQALLIRNK